MATRDGRTPRWEDVGRELLRQELKEQQFDLEATFRKAGNTLSGTGGGDCSGDLTPEHITAMRRVLNRARLVVEEAAAPAAGCEPWGDDPPKIPAGVLYELTDHPNADGVDPREYLDDEDAEES